MHAIIFFMGWFALCSDITVGSFRFAGAHEVRVKRSIHSYMETATIKVPSICKIAQGKRSSPTVVPTGTLFNDGAPVTINLGYNDSIGNYLSGGNLTGASTPIIPGNNTGLGTVFQGFVKRRTFNMPMEIECEGYSYLMRHHVDVTAKYAKTSAAALLKLISEQVAINVVVADDLPLINVLLYHCNGIEICDAIKRFSQGILNVFFINPNTLWCGLTYTPYSRGKDPFGLGVVNYRLGWNVVKDNSLRQRVTSEPVQIIFGGTLANGNKVESQSDLKTARNKDKAIMNNVGDRAAMKMMANEKQYKANYAGYEGNINAFLQPYCAPGWLAKIVDDRYPERNGDYMVEGTEIIYGVKGARIKVEIGPLLGFKPNS